MQKFFNFLCQTFLLIVFSFLSFQLHLVMIVYGHHKLTIQHVCEYDMIATVTQGTQAKHPY